MQENLKCTLGNTPEVQYLTVWAADLEKTSVNGDYSSQTIGNHIIIRWLGPFCPLLQWPLAAFKEMSFWRSAKLHYRGRPSAYSIASGGFGFFGGKKGNKDKHWTKKPNQTITQYIHILLPSKHKKKIWNDDILSSQPASLFTFSRC